MLIRSQVLKLIEIFFLIRQDFSLKIIWFVLPTAKVKTSLPIILSNSLKFSNSKYRVESFKMKKLPGNPGGPIKPGGPMSPRSPLSPGGPIKWLMFGFKICCLIFLMFWLNYLDILVNQEVLQFQAHLAVHWKWNTSFY